MTRLACLGLTALLLAPVLAVRTTRLARGVVVAVHELSTDDFEQRRLESYGDCEPRGYGYVRRVLAGFPDAEAMPTMQHKQPFGGDLALLLPRPRARPEPRILIGVGTAEPPAAADGRRFIVVGRHDGCFTAVRDDLLAEITHRGGLWTQWLDDVRSIR